MMPRSGKINFFTGLTVSFGSIYLSVERYNLEPNCILVFPFVSPDSTSDNRFLLFHWFYKCPVVLSPATKRVTSQEKFAECLFNPRVLRPWETKTADESMVLYFCPWLQWGLYCHWVWEHYWKDVSAKLAGIWYACIVLIQYLLWHRDCYPSHFFNVDVNSESFCLFFTVRRKE